MSHYSNNPAMVRVDFFKESGKWYTTEQMEMLGGWDKETLVHDVFIKALGRAFPEHYHEFTAVCLEPYHENAYPLMVKDWWERYNKLLK